MPPRLTEAAAVPVPPNWNTLFREAGFDMAKFIAVPPLWVPPVFGDTRAAWTGAYPDRPDIAIRVEATAWRGRPVYFQIFEPWSPTTLGGVRTGPQRLNAATVSLFVIFAAVVTGAFLLARRNLRLRRGDESGAFCARCTSSRAC
jgi:hypothetical protein